LWYSNAATGPVGWLLMLQSGSAWYIQMQPDKKCWQQHTNYKAALASLHLKVRTQETLFQAALHCSNQ
jgi:hypothetical protein